MHLIILTLIITSLHCVYISYPLFTPPPVYLALSAI